MDRTDAPRRHRGGDDAGFTLMEVLVAVAIIAVVMLGLGAVFIATAAGTDAQGSRQVAARLATDGLERARALGGAAVVQGLPTAPEKSTVDGLVYTRTLGVTPCYVDATGACGATNTVGSLPMYDVVVTVTWPGTGCAKRACSYQLSTLLAANMTEPLFNNTVKATAPVIAAITTNPVQDLGEAADGPKVGASGGNGQLTITASGLPNGVKYDASTGTFTGTLATAGPATTVTVTVTDEFGLFSSTTFTWTVNPLPALTGAAVALTTGVAAAVDLPTVLKLTGGTTGYTWACAKLPLGLSVDPKTGALSGVTTVLGAVSPTCTVTDARGKTASAALALTVLPPLTVTTKGTVTLKYGTTLPAGLATATCAVACTWTADQLPAGVTVNAAGALSGTPARVTTTTTTTTTFTVVDVAGRTATGVLIWKVTA